MNGSKRKRNGYLRSLGSGIVLSGIVSLLAFGGSAEAATLAWDRNSESDMDHYNLYGCFTAGCTVAQNNTMKQAGTVLQTPTGTIPSVVVTITGKTGNYAVSASDASGNESGLSVPVPFDALAPSAPINPRLLP